MNCSYDIRPCQVQDLVIALHRTSVPWLTLLGIDDIVPLPKSISLDHGAHRSVQYHYLVPIKYSHFPIPKRLRIYKKMPILHHRPLTKSPQLKIRKFMNLSSHQELSFCRWGSLVQNIEQAHRPYNGLEWHFSCSMRSKWRHRAGISASQRPGTPLALLDELHECYLQYPFPCFFAKCETKSFYSINLP